MKRFFKATGIRWAFSRLLDCLTDLALAIQCLVERVPDHWCDQNDAIVGDKWIDAQEYRRYLLDRHLAATTFTSQYPLSFDMD